MGRNLAETVLELLADPPAASMEGNGIVRSNVARQREALVEEETQAIQNDRRGKGDAMRAVFWQDGSNGSRSCVFGFFDHQDDNHGEER